MNSSLLFNASKIVKRLKQGRVIVLNTVRSTNQYIIDNLQYMQVGDVFVTDHQTHGRGRYGKFWITPYGQGLALSMYWKISHRFLITEELSVIISFVVAKVLRKFGVSQITIKQPNDLYVYDHKLAGILVEVITKNKFDSHLIIGVGINLSISTCIQSIMLINKNWIDLKKLGVFLDYDILVVSLVKELRLAMKKFEYHKYILI